MITSSGDQGECLPNWHEVVAAFTSWHAAAAHPVTVCAFQLSWLHRQFRTNPPGPAPVRHRAELIAAIDAWVVEHVREPERVQSLGAYIDRMAAAFTQAMQVLRGCESVGDAVHAAVTEAAALAAGWDEIITDAVPLSYGSRWTDDV